jgi:hypothetical protein
MYFCHENAECQTTFKYVCLFCIAGLSSLGILPLPLAALVILTITYKLDKASERFLNLAGPALESLAASCLWPKGEAMERFPCVFSFTHRVPPEQRSSLPNSSEAVRVH